MKVCHWSLTNGSGMHRVAESIAQGERAMGVDSVLCDCSVRSAEWDAALDADVHVVHTHLPDEIHVRSTRPFKVVWVAHGTPDHVFQSAVEQGSTNNVWAADPLMLMQYWLKTADARVTFWPRHQYIYQSMVDRGTTVHCVPLGVDNTFWSAGGTNGKYAGSPSVFTAENSHYIKWPYDLFVAWPDVFKRTDRTAKLHAIYLPRDQHRFFFPLVNSNGASYASFIAPNSFSREQLRNAFQSVDYVIGLVRYGDFNQLSLQANAAGATTISYVGNPYADYWVHEGDQRTIADELVDIFAGKTPRRQKDPVPDIADTAAAMIAIYTSLMS